jgi:hypothetical protein
MATILSAGTTTSTALNLTADTSGSLVLASNNGTTAVTIDANQNATFANTATFTGNINAPNTFGFKNRIINGAMVIDQRNAGVVVTPASFSYTLDRFGGVQTTASKFSVQQDSSANTVAGFTSSLKVTSLSAYSVGAGDTFNIYQSVEGFNCFDFAWGTASAKTVTLSFWVRSSLTGTFGGAIKDGSSTNAYPFTYTISVANTWEQKTITIVGPTSGQFSYTSTTNGIGLQVMFGLGAGATYSGTAGAWAAFNAYTATGATSVVGTSGATWYVTGVQLETGTKATSFEYRDYGRELQLCLRYYWHANMAAGNVHFFIPMMPSNPAGFNVGQIPLTTPLRTAPVLVLYPAYNTGSSWNLNNAIVNYSFTGIPIVYNYSAGNSPSSVAISLNTSTGMNIGYPVHWYNNTGVNGYVALNAEL